MSVAMRVVSSTIIQVGDESIDIKSAEDAKLVQLSKVIFVAHENDLAPSYLDHIIKDLEKQCTDMFPPKATRDVLHRYAHEWFLHRIQSTITIDVGIKNMQVLIPRRGGLRLDETAAILKSRRHDITKLIDSVQISLDSCNIKSCPNVYTAASNLQKMWNKPDTDGPTVTITIWGEHEIGLKTGTYQQAGNIKDESIWSDHMLLILSAYMYRSVDLRSTFPDEIEQLAYVLFGLDNRPSRVALLWALERVTAPWEKACSGDRMVRFISKDY
jgi:hypothetical protein